MVHPIRVASGAITIVGGVFMLMVAILMLQWISAIPEWQITGIIVLILASSSILGGLLSIFDKAIGGILALICGMIGLIGLLIPIGDVTLTNSLLPAGIDPLLVVMGGMLGIPSY